jgi:hypothetical protein
MYNSKSWPEKKMDVITKILRHISQSLQANTRILFYLVQDDLFPNPSNSLFINHYITWCYIILAADSVTQ